jgi:hypothetical protein
MEHQLAAAQENTEPTAAAAKEATTAEVQEEAPAEAGLVDITSILGAPTVTVVRSSLQVLNLSWVVLDVVVVLD